MIIRDRALRQGGERSVNSMREFHSSLMPIAFTVSLTPINKSILVWHLQHPIQRSHRKGPLLKIRILIRMGLVRTGALIGMGALIGIGALINKNTFKEGGLFEKGRLLEGGR